MSNLLRLAELKAAGTPIVMVTAYDFPSAQVADAAGVDVVLVGDSAATTVLGHDSTVPVGMTEMIVLAAAVRRGLSPPRQTREPSQGRPLLVGDLPFGSYEISNEQAVGNAIRLVKDAGCDTVKLERGGASAERARAIVDAGIPVMGHIGLTPQTAVQLGGLKAQGRSATSASRLLAEAVALESAGCFSIVFEAIPAAVTELLMPRIGVPVIGIGAGPATDGQVLVFHDLLGLLDGPAARFVKRYANVREQLVQAVSTYAGEVRAREYPGPEHTYAIPDAELAAFRREIAE